MRILTNSPHNSKGLIKVIEADEHGPQHVVFCIPIEIDEAENIGNLNDFRKMFSNGIVTKIKKDKAVNTIALELFQKSFFKSNKNGNTPKFIAAIGGYKIDFHLSSLNFMDFQTDSKLSINFFYDGVDRDLRTKRFIILEPDWKLLDKLFLEQKILFTDWE
jgi:hypothetical protein